MTQPLTVTRPDLAFTWWSPNNTVKPEDISHGSHQVVLWQCPEVDNHEFPTKVAYMSRRTGCRLCTKQIIIPGINDAVTTHGDFIHRYFDYSKNTLDPRTVSAGTAKRAWWLCPDCSYGWLTSFLSVTRGSGCARCAGVIPNPGVNTVDVLFPDLVENFWNTKANKKTPREVTPGSTYSVGLKCPDCPATWRTSAYNFFTIGTRCPGCANKTVFPGINDVFTTDPGVIRRYWSSKNTVQPTEVTRGSNTKVYWECDEQHLRFVPVVSVVVNKTDCLECRQPESKAQRQVREYIAEIYDGTILETPTRTVIYPREIDIYLPDVRLAVEVNGVFHHSTYYAPHRDKRRDQEKSVELLKKGINFLSIWTDDWKYDTNECKDRIKQMIHNLCSGNLPAPLDECIVLPLDKHYGQVFAEQWGISEVNEPSYRNLKGNKRLCEGEGSSELPRVYDYGQVVLRYIEKEKD